MFGELALFLFFLALLSRWVLTSIGGRGGNPQLEAQHTAELARLREEVDALTAQVASLQDEQSFMMRLLTDGRQGGDEAALPRPEGASELSTTNPETHGHA
jgi:cell division protein FtsB